MTTLPHNLDAEQGLLGAVMFDNGLLDRLPPVRADDFYDAAHGAIWSEMVKTIRGGRSCDPQTLRSWFMAQEFSPALGGSTYLLTLLDKAARLESYAVDYARIVGTNARRREIVATARAMEAAALNDGDPDTVVIEAERALAEVSAKDDGEAVWSLASVATRAVARAQVGELAGISTGIHELDACTGGLRPSTLWILGGATSMGKSVAGVQIAANVAAQGYAVCYISLEMTADDIGLRATSSFAFDPANKSWGPTGNPAYLDAARGKLSNAQWDRMFGAAKAVATLPIYGTDRPALTLARIEAEVRRAERKAKRDGYDLRLIVIDHEGLIAPEGRFPSQLEEARARGNGLLALAKRTGKSVLALSQITKEGARADGEDRLPNLNDINYGSALTQAADVVALLHRKAYYAERKPKSARTDADLDALSSKEALIVVDKARGGARKQVAVCIDLPSAKMYVAGEMAA